MFSWSTTIFSTSAPWLRAPLKAASSRRSVFPPILGLPITPRILKTARSLLQALLDLLEHLGQCAADGAFGRGGSFHGVPAYLADEERLVGHGLSLMQVAQGRLEEAVMRLLDLV